MVGEEDWIMRPVLRGMCTMEGLKDGTLDLEDVALMNEAIDVEEENRRRIVESTSGH
jgi:hypothetical protein